MTTKIPDTLLRHLLEAQRAGLIRPLSARSWAAIGRMLQGDEPHRVEADRCPSCGYVVRLRPGLERAVEKIVTDWSRGPASPRDAAR